ncbi:hypothetical protein CALCODRAFT_513568 [Calocera cornea HHB12733]|uniref:Uncharacterized protein n=1 Tax=Calocera cornea HHB12733 TaxID=1353952 RepID=A0A165BZ70_9BASI|nr:hypothetical protein CALCODRAFT_513568 [Calocera cornea HHB12733]
MQAYAEVSQHFRGIQCYRCPKIIGPNDDWRSFIPIDPVTGKECPTVNACLACYEVYVGRNKTQIRPAEPLPKMHLPSVEEFAQPNIEELRAETAHAQRTRYHEGKSPVCAIGLRIQNMDIPVPPQPTFPLGHRSMAHPSQEEPFVAPMLVMGSQHPVPLARGYNANHANYPQNRRAVHNLAFDMSREEEITINASVKHYIPRKSEPLLLFMIARV